MRGSDVRTAVVSLALAAFCAFGRPVHAQHAPLAMDRVYVVQHGDTVSAVAAQLGVTSRALAERNHLAPPYALRVGRRLRLPDGVDPTIARRLPPRDGTAAAATPDRSSGSSSTGSARGWGRPRQPGVVSLYRELNDETLTLNLRRATRTTGRRMEHFLRFGDGRSHAIHTRLMRQIAIVSDHFGGRRLHVVSGFRPFRRGQWTAHSNHNVGNAMDFRIEGVPNRVLRDFCRTLPNTGCGYYPRSVFVHMDVRDESATWVDWSRPGQRPQYGREDRPPTENANAHRAPPPAASADESVDDVAEDSPRVRNAPANTDDSEGEMTAGGPDPGPAVDLTPPSGASAAP